MNKIKCIAVAMIITSFFNSCSVESDRSEKIRDLEFTVVEEVDLPVELKALIEEKKQNTFKLTYMTNDYLYIIIGYGEQKSGGYSINVNELYLSENAIYVDTNLIGPGTEETINDTKSYPYIVVKVEKLNENVVFK